MLGVEKTVVERVVFDEDEGVIVASVRRLEARMEASQSAMIRAGRDNRAESAL